MPYFMVQGSYTSDAWAKMIHNPEDREKLYAFTREFLNLPT